MTNELTIITQENVQMIAQNAPQMFNECKSSHDKCLAAGNALLAKIQAAGKMDDNLDQECALYIDRVKKTLKKMNDARSPLTKLLDEFKTVFTTMENDVNVTKSSTTPGQIQAARNAFAAEKRAEEERRRQEEIRRQMEEKARNQWKQDCDEEFHQFFNASLNSSLNALADINASITLENYEEKAQALKSFPVSLPETWHTDWRTQLRLPLEFSRDEALKMRDEVRLSLESKFKEQYTFEVESSRDDLVNRLASKKKELEAIEKASAEEAARRRAEIAAREAEEARRKEEERKAREEEERKRAEIEKQNAEVNDLFGQVAAEGQLEVSTYTPKTSVKLRINVLNVEGYPAIFGLWWAKVGCTLSKEELDKTFKTQITFCEKMANDKTNHLLLESEHVEYVEEVKAR